MRYPARSPLAARAAVVSPDRMAWITAEIRGCWMKPRGSARGLGRGATLCLGSSADLIGVVLVVAPVSRFSTAWIIWPRRSPERLSRRELEFSPPFPPFPFPCLLRLLPFPPEKLAKRSLRPFPPFPTFPPLPAFPPLPIKLDMSDNPEAPPPNKPDNPARPDADPAAAPAPPPNKLDSPEPARPAAPAPAKPACPSPNKPESPESPDPPAPTPWTN